MRRQSRPATASLVTPGKPDVRLGSAGEVAGHVVIVKLRRVNLSSVQSASALASPTTPVKETVLVDNVPLALVLQRYPSELASVTMAAWSLVDSE